MQSLVNHSFKVSIKQKKTLLLLRSKYKMNTSRFIRDAINEKLERDKDSIFSKYKEIQAYLNDINSCPF